MLVSSSDWYVEQMGRCGGWDNWIYESVSGKDYATHKPHFVGYVVCGKDIGRASAAIVLQALQAGKPVLALEDGRMDKVTKLAVVNEDNWAEGWSITTEPLEAA